MAELEEIRRRVGPRMTDDEGQALAKWYETISRAVSAFPAGDLKDVEPPLRSFAAPPRP